jgi:N-acetylneuraminic acid mutarotase
VATVEIYNVSRNRWRNGPDLPLAVNHPAGFALDGIVYVFGGYRGPGTDNPTRRAFAFENGEWSEIAPMPGPRAAAGAAAAGGRIYVVGGVAGDGLGRRTFVYNPVRNAWSGARGLPTPRQHLGVGRYQGKIYAVGGRVGGLRSNLDDLERYNPATDRWTRLPPLPTRRGGLAAAGTSNGLIVAAGGEARGGTFDEVEAFVVSRRRWRSLPRMPTARHGLGVVALGTRVFVLAGGPQPGLTFSDANESIRLR